MTIAVDADTPIAKPRATAWSMSIPSQPIGYRLSSSRFANHQPITIEAIDIPDT